MVTKTKTPESIAVQELDKRVTSIKVKSIEGSGYIQHRLSPSTMKAIEEKVTGKAVKGKHKIRDFDAEYKSCFWKTFDGKPGIPAAQFRGALLETAVACGIHKTDFKRAVRVLGDVYEMKYKTLVRRIDNPRQGGPTGAPDIRHRPEFFDWECVIDIQYDANQITADQIVNLTEQAGFSVGIGDWRPLAPKSTGSHGMFEVVKKAN